MPARLPAPDHGLFAAVRAFVAALYPDRIPVRVKIELNEGKSVALPVPLVPGLAPGCDLGPPSHSPDFRAVYWFGTLYEFSPAQARAVGVLWGAYEAWRAGERASPDVPANEILNAIESNADHLRDLFRGHPAWGVLVVKHREGYRLEEPAE